MIFYFVSSSNYLQLFDSILPRKIRSRFVFWTYPVLMYFFKYVWRNVDLCFPIGKQSEKIEVLHNFESKRSLLNNWILAVLVMIIILAFRLPVRYLHWNTQALHVTSAGSFTRWVDFPGVAVNLQEWQEGEREVVECSTSIYFDQ